MLSQILWGPDSECPQVQPLQGSCWTSWARCHSTWQSFNVVTGIQTHIMWFLGVQITILKKCTRCKNSIFGAYLARSSGLLLLWLACFVTALLLINFPQACHVKMYFFFMSNTRCDSKIWRETPFRWITVSHSLWRHSLSIQSEICKVTGGHE